MPSRFKFSLRALLLLVLAFCIAMGFYLTARRLRDAERELLARRNETGYLSVDDRTQLHAVQVDTEEPNTWKWRLFIPKGHRYSWNLACDDIPQNEVPENPGSSGFSNEPYWERDNEVLVTVRLRKLDDGHSELSVDSRIGDSKNQMHGTSLRIPDEKLSWMTKVSSTDGQVLGRQGTEIRDPKGAVILLQRRTCERQADGSYQPSQHRMPGFIVWLQEL